MKNYSHVVIKNKDSKKANCLALNKQKFTTVKSKHNANKELCSVANAILKTHIKAFKELSQW